MRNDPYSIPEASLKRGLGHSLCASQSKIVGLFKPLQATGVPLGGIGTGGITRASDGRFSRWTLKAGSVAKFAMPANGFILRTRSDNGTPSAVALQPAPDTEELRAFSYEQEAPEWGGLFPFAWHRHGEFNGIEAECQSFSPIIPGDFASAVLPVAVFNWRLTNNSAQPADVSLAFTFANLSGWFADFTENRPRRVAAGCFNRPFELENGTGVILDRREVSNPPPEGTGEWAVSISADTDAEYGRTLCFDGTGIGAEFWKPFVETGDAPNLGQGWVSESGFRETPPSHPTAAVSARIRLAPGESKTIRATLTWDMPVITFEQGRRWYRAHTDTWGTSGRNAARLTRHAYRNASDWERRIAEWHDVTRKQLGDAPHQSGMAINESYFLVDGLTVATSANGSPDGRPHFGMIECHDYALYNTMDLWIYAAEAVGQFFPELAASVAHDYADLLLRDDQMQRRHRWDANLFPLNPRGACPHDLGGPGEDPFVVPNSYTYRDSTLWKDLNCDLVLCIFREGATMGLDWRRAHFAAVKAAIDHLQQFDTDGDGLIENDGTPDQTFDNIPMTGPSSYCGGLWIAALLAGAELATEAGETALSKKWRDQAQSAKGAFNTRLFNGAWFRVDTDGMFSEACFIEQLFGPFLARRLGLGDIVSEEHARSALLEIYRQNFIEAGSGEGAVSLTGLSEAALSKLPHSDDPTFQTAEIQPGFNFSFAAQLNSWQLHEEADHLRKALYHQLYGVRNLVFQTPAAFDKNSKTCRAILNMRPMAAWWIADPTMRKRGI